MKELSLSEFKSFSKGTLEGDSDRYPDGRNKPRAG
jgi:hypothetical protein